MWLPSQSSPPEVTVLSLSFEIFTLHWSRSKPFDPDREDGGGKNFVLFAFVNDVGEDVTEGVDGIEHMSTILITFQ